MGTVPVKPQGRQTQLSTPAINIWLNPSSNSHQLVCPINLVHPPIIILLFRWIRIFSVSHERYLNGLNWNHRTLTRYDAIQLSTIPARKATRRDPPLSALQQTLCLAPAGLLEVLMSVGAFWKGQFSVWQRICFVLRVWMRCWSLKKTF